MPTNLDEADKRERRFRSKCPQKVAERIVRAKQEKLVVLKQGHVSSNYSCRFKISGSTGNVYKVKIGKVPTCTCPDFEKREDACKHTLFVLLKIIGVDVNDGLLYQKAFTINELKTLFDKMKANKRSAARYYLEEDKDQGAVDELVSEFATTNIEEGGYQYTNVRGVTGQREHRDRSTYRPFHWESPPYKRWH